MQPRHADVVNPLDSVAHKVSRHRGLFGNRKIGSAGSHDSNDSGPLGQRRCFKSQTAGRLMMDRMRKLFLHGSGMFRGHPRGENSSVGRQNFPSNRHHLFRGFARAKDDLREPLAQGSMLINDGKPEIHHRGRLEGLKDLLDRHLTIAKTF